MSFIQSLFTSIALFVGSFFGFLHPVPVTVVPIAQVVTSVEQQVVQSASTTVTRNLRQAEVTGPTSSIQATTTVSNPAVVVQSTNSPATTTTPFILEISSKGHSPGELYAGTTAYVTGTGLKGQVSIKFGGQAIITASSDDDIDTTFVVPAFPMPTPIIITITNSSGAVSNEYHAQLVTANQTTYSQPISEIPTIVITSPIKSMITVARNTGIHWEWSSTGEASNITVYLITSTGQALSINNMYPNYGSYSWTAGQALPWWPNNQTLPDGIYGIVTCPTGEAIDSKNCGRFQVDITS